MKRVLTSIRSEFPECDNKTIERAFILSYARQNNLNYKESSFIYSFIGNTDAQCQFISDYIDQAIKLKSIDELIMVFEILIDSADKKNKGVVYTPLAIREYISERVIKSDKIPVLIDPACGCGAFLISAVRKIKNKFDVPYEDLFAKYVYGADIDSHGIEKCKVLLCLLALETDGEIIKDLPNLLICNSLEYFHSDKYRHKFDVVIGNPPYVRARNIDEPIKKSLLGWSTVTGNTDLYIPFYQIGMELLKNGGMLGYISPNTYLQSVNGRGLRNYIRDAKASAEIINFKGAQNFPGVTSYTCITLIKMDNCPAIDYSINADGCLKGCQYTHYDISSFADNQPWRFVNSKIDQLIYKIEHQPKKLDDYGIRNGLATLCNDIFFFTIEKEDNNYYHRTYNGKKYKIEKKICIDIAKPNIMKSEADLIKKGEKAIFPYENRAVIPEGVFSSKYPNAYAFLLEYKDKLDSRDKGKTGNYPAWYAYGRTQGMNNAGLKILIPCMADRGVAIISENKSLLFYSGYAIFAKDKRTLLLLKYFIESDVFWLYIRMTSKPYSKGFMALAKNYIKNFGIPALSGVEEESILTLPPEKREEFIAGLYGLTHEDVKHYIGAAT